MKKILTFLLAAALSLSMMTGCSGQSASSSAEEEITLRFSWWGGDERHEPTLEMIRLYEEKNPGIHIEAEYSGYDGYREKLATQISGGQAPDIIQIDMPWTASFVNSNPSVFLDLNTVSDIIDLNQFDPQLLESTCTVNDVLVGLPSGINASGYIINQDVVDQYGLDLKPDTDITWNDLLEEGKKLHEQDESKYLLLSSSYELVTEFLRPILSQLSGKQIVQDDYTLGVTKEDFVQAFTLLGQMYENNVLEPIELADVFNHSADQNPAWLNGNLCSYINWSSVVTGANMRFENTTVLHHPMLEDAKDSGVIVRPTQLFVISGTSQHAQEAAKFLNFMLNDEEAISILKDVRGTPASQIAREICQENDYLNPIGVEMVNLGIEMQGMTVNSMSDSEEITQILTDILERACYAQEDIETLSEEAITLLEQKASELKAAA